MLRRFSCIAIVLAATPFFQAAAWCAEPVAPVDFAKQIQPLFARHCAECHGEKNQQSGLRVDRGSLLVKGGDRGASVVPGKSGESILYQALLGKQDITRMPQDKPPLADDEIALVKRWIDEGAKIPEEESTTHGPASSKHWSFQPVVRPAIPVVKQTDWVRNAIDMFILARLEREGIDPSVEADRATLVRRLSLDLRGLPPSIAEIDEFVTDDSPAAYERLVDRFLASPHYGERWGRAWLDAARYADSNGFTIDSPRSIWSYRDWVIDAINADLPFDRFTIEQLAGDMLPDHTTEQVVATGFHRNTLINEEGGTDDEQFRVESIVDRVNTTGSVFLGLSVGCGQCHNHKYDPITQRDYYNLFAIFNNCDEPEIRVPSADQAKALDDLDAKIAAIEKPLAELDNKLLADLPKWEQQVAAQSAGAWTLLDPAAFRTETGAVLTKLADKSLIVDFSVPANDSYIVDFNAPLDEITAVRIEALTHPSLPMMGPGRGGNGNFVLSEFELQSAPLAAAGTGAQEKHSVKIASAVADHSQEGYPVAYAIDGNQKTGWAINVKKGSLNVNREAVFFPAEPIRNAGGSKLTVTLRHNHFDANFLIGRFRVWVSGAPADLLRIPSSVRNIIQIAADKRTPEQREQLETAFKATHKEYVELTAKLDALKSERERFVKTIPTTLVLKERAEPRESHILLRGDFLRKGARLYGGVPDAFPPLPKEVKTPTRLDLARWLVDPGNPLTARVTINRYWQVFFGAGLVETENDFGTQGAPPTHPQMLDWLASEFIRREWSMKQIHRLIVTSATYRQSSVMRADLAARDPSNKLLARQSRLRLEAEAVRDVTLAAAGLISHAMHGPGVYPPQPEGIYALTQQKKSWPEDKDADRFRRGLYIHFWRSSPYPFLPTFDAPDANTACTRRPRSNTPLQALTLANDRAFVEMAKGLAERILRESPSSTDERLQYAFRVSLGREPTKDEFQRMLSFLAEDQQQRQQASGKADDLSTWTAVARVLLNLDEFITRE